MPGGSLKIGRLAGIPIGVSPLWFAIVALITWSLGAAYYPEQVDGIGPVPAYLLGLASALLLFASILLHELGHAVVARRRGVAIEGIDLWLLGGVAKLRGTPRSGGDELRYAVAGPAVTVVIIAIFGAVSAVLPDGTPDALRALVSYQLLVNTLILGFNLVPAFPLDGGRLLRAALWARSGDLARATSIAATVGRAFASLLIALGVVAAFAGAPAGLWFVLIGFFLVLAGRAEESALAVRRTFAGHEAGELASFPAVTIPAGLSAADAARDYFSRYRYQSFPVVGPAGVLGLLMIGRLEGIGDAELEQTPVESLIEADPALLVDEQTDIAELLESRSFQRVGHVMVTGDGSRLGILSATDVERALRASRLMPRQA
ncbi:MAG: site-2 protease family protein [Thermoleophilia bacterium]|nr:site-2 protease family protein [Thermoleophilia bacterium]